MLPGRPPRLNLRRVDGQEHLPYTRTPFASNRTSVNLHPCTRVDLSRPCEQILSRPARAQEEIDDAVARRSTLEDAARHAPSGELRPVDRSAKPAGSRPAARGFESSQASRLEPFCRIDGFTRTARHHAHADVAQHQRRRRRRLSRARRAARQPPFRHEAIGRAPRCAAGCSTRRRCSPRTPRRPRRACVKLRCAFSACSGS